MGLDLKALSIPDAKIVQNGLKALGFYKGTTWGIPGPLTKAAYARYMKSHGEEEIQILGSGGSIGKLLIEILKGEEGVREIPRNSNRGKDVQKYQAATWLDGTGWAWCAAFICWGLQEVGKKISLPFDRPQTAGAWDFERWAREQKLTLFEPRKKIKAGDIVVFSFSHIGLAIEDEKGGNIRTIEGNTDSSGSREGGGVYTQIRKTSLVRSHIRLDV